MSDVTWAIVLILLAAWLVWIVIGFIRRDMRP